MFVDASRITKRLYQGGEPPTGPFVAHSGFDVLVLCAEECQPPALNFPGVTVLHCPLDDVARRLTNDEVRRIRHTGRGIARHLIDGKRVLVTCAMGINRSGLVVASALLHATPLSPADAIRAIRLGRGSFALANKGFVRAILDGEVGGERRQAAR